MIELSQFLAASIFVFAILFCFARVSHRDQITLLEWAILGVGLVYGLGWVLVLTFTVNGHNPLWVERILPFERYFVIHNFLVLALIISIIFGYRVFERGYKAGRKLSLGYLGVSAGQLEVYGWFLLMIAVFLRWLYVSAFGGFFDYLDYSMSIRSAFFEVQNKWSFLQPFSGVGLFATFLFFASLLGERKTYSKALGLLVSLLFSIYLLYSMLGRMGFLIFVATIVLAFLSVKGVRPVLIVAGGVVGALLMLVLAFVISDLLQIKSALSMQDYVARELSFPFVSFFAQIEHGEYLYRWFQDFLFAPLYLLPSSLWVQWIDNVSQINTLVVLGARKGDSGVTGGIPVDLLTLGLMQVSVVGVVGVGLIFGCLLSFLQGFVDGVRSDGLRAILWAYLAIRVSVFAVAYAHPVHLISGLFGIIFSIFLIFVFEFLGKFRIQR